MYRKYVTWGRRVLRIKRIQRGSFTLGGGVTSATQAILAVDLENTLVRTPGFTSGGFADLAKYSCLRLELTNSTTLTGYVDTASYGGTINYEVVEYWPGVIRSVQRGTVALGSTTTITRVVLENSTLDSLGFTTTQGSIWNIHLRVSFDDIVTVRATASGGSGTAGYQAVEWY